MKPVSYAKYIFYKEKNMQDLCKMQFYKKMHPHSL